MGPASTSLAILDAAEQLFAEQGYDGTSVREITRHADVNVAAVHYHFGDKAAVLRAVTSRVVDPMNQRRLRLLDLARAEASPGLPSVEGVLSAFIGPDIDTLLALQRRGATVAHLLGRIYSDQTDWIREMTRDQFAAAEHAFVPLLAEVLPHLSAEEIGWRMRQIAAVLVNTFATWPDEELAADAAGLLLRRLVTFAAAALRAPTVADTGEVPTPQQ